MKSLLADFSSCNSDTISMLFKSYCVNIYGSQIWKFYNKEVNICILHDEKKFAKYINYHIEHKYLKKIILSSVILLMNSEHILFNRIIKFSLTNMSTTIGENIKYFMYKYNVTMSDWCNSFSYIDKKIDVHVNRKVDMNVKYIAHAIQD